MSERMPAATAAVVGQTTPSVQEHGLGANIAAKLRAHHPEQARRIEEVAHRKRLHAGHARYLPFVGHPNDFDMRD